MLIESDVPLPEALAYRNLAELLLRGDGARDPAVPLLLGTLGDRQVDVGAGQLRAFLLDFADTLRARGIGPGDTVCLIRLPRTSELPIALAYAALSALGVRVLLPMYPEPAILRQWLDATGARAVLWSAWELREAGGEADLLRLHGVESLLSERGVPALCLCDDLALPTALAAADPLGPRRDDPRIERLIASAGSDAECLILTTAGTSGQGKLVRYRQRSLLRSCASWQAGGLFQPQLLGGRGLCLLFAHSMGVRAFWNAVWTGRAMCLVPPEWFLEHPERACALLQRMRPEHVTGGPAVYWALLELARVFPGLKESGLESLRCAVSSGAPFDPDLARRVEAGLGLRLHNAFGTTETMQVLSTLLSGEGDISGLGAPLPGVRIALEPLEEDPSLCRLLVQSPFGCDGYLPLTPGEPAQPAPDWYPTGDLVRRTGAGLSFVGREHDEFVKDGFGVKVSRRLLAERYRDLGDPVRHLEWFPLCEEPGLAALLYVGDAAPGTTADGRVTDRALLRRVRALLEARHDALELELDDFELRHLTVTRFACLAGSPPRTPKGNVSRSAIERTHVDLLRELRGKDVRRPGVVRLDRERLLRSATTRFVRPHQGELLRLLRLDKHVVAARGDRLMVREKGSEREVVDFVGGFGTTLLGHRHPEVVAAAQRFLEGAAPPLADQGSERPAEGALARRLARAVSRHTGGSYVVRFGSTGAEAVEMALAHAWLEREDRLERFVREQRRLFGGVRPERVAEIVRRAEVALRGPAPQVLAIAGSYHGASLGARAVSEMRRSRRTFASLSRIEPIFLSPEGDADLDRIVRDAAIRVPALVWRDGRAEEDVVLFSRIVCAIAEPIRGEGGIAVVSPALLARLASYEFPLILDEIQCGLGRSGRFLASEGVRGHIYLFGKALGGGVAKVSAALIDRSRYVERFDDCYAGTFAGDAFSSAVASATLDVIERDDVPGRARERGAELRRRLEAIRDDFPTVVRQVSGAGLMLGVELAPAVAAESMLVRTAVEREHLGLLAATYLLNRWDVRVLPTLSAPNTLRLEPSAYVDAAALEALERGLRAFCAAIASRDLAEVLGILVADETALGEAPRAEPALPPFRQTIEPPAEGAVRIAFLNHFVFPERELVFLESSLGRLSKVARRALFHRLAGMMELQPTVAFGRNLFGGRVWFASIVLPVDPATLEEMHRSGRREFAVRRVQEGLDLGRSLGCTIGGLGAYTSIVTADGMALLPPPGMTLSSGNAFTVAVGARRVLRLCRNQAIDPAAEGSRLGVLGATGNIGSALARRFVQGEEPFRRVLLVGRCDTALRALADELRAATLGLCEVEHSTDLAALRGCNVIAAATGTNEPLLYPRHFGDAGPVVLADLSVPSIVAARVRRMRHVHVVPLAGCVRLPGEPDFVMGSHIQAGTVFSCAAESMLLALAPEETADLTLVGTIRDQSVERLESLAERLGLLGPAVVAAAAGAQA